MRDHLYLQCCIIDEKGSIFTADPVNALHHSSISYSLLILLLLQLPDQVCDLALMDTYFTVISENSSRDQSLV